MQFQLGDQHAKLSAPVAHMVLANHIVALIFQQARQTVANNGGAQMADMHFFSQVGRGIINHYSLWIRAAVVDISAQLLG